MKYVFEDHTLNTVTEIEAIDTVEAMNVAFAGAHLTWDGGSDTRAKITSVRMETFDTRWIIHATYCGNVQKYTLGLMS